MVFEGFFENIPATNTCRLRDGVALDLSQGTLSVLNATANSTVIGIEMIGTASATASTTTGISVSLSNVFGTASALYGGTFSVSLSLTGAGTAMGLQGTFTAGLTGGNASVVGVGVNGRAVIPDRAMTGGYYGVLAQINSSGNVSAVPATSNACLGISAGTGTALIPVVNAIAFTATDSATGMIYTKTATPVFTGYIRILVNGAIRYMPFTTTTA